MCRILKCQESELETLIDYTMMRDFLLSYQRSGEGKKWEEFRNKIPAPLLAKWGTICIECRRNGFMAPIATPERILWHQITAAHGDSETDLCTLCDRECRRKAYVENGMTKHDRAKEPKACWRV